MCQNRQHSAPNPFSHPPTPPILFPPKKGILLFNCSPRTFQLASPSAWLAMVISLLQIAGTLLSAFLASEIVVIAQRMRLLEFRAHQLQAVLMEAFEILSLPRHLRTRVHRYNQFLEIQYDKAALDVLYSTSSEALAIEIKIYLFAPLIENAEFFRVLAPRSVVALLSEFQEEIFR